MPSPCRTHPDTTLEHTMTANLTPFGGVGVLVGPFHCVDAAIASSTIFRNALRSWVLGATEADAPGPPHAVSVDAAVRTDTASCTEYRNDERRLFMRFPSPLKGTLTTNT